MASLTTSNPLASWRNHRSKKPAQNADIGNLAHVALRSLSSPPMRPAPLERYLQEIESNLQRGNATEHTHRPALKALLEGLLSGVVATNEPKRVACGAPDFIIELGSAPLGYVEAKDITIDLDTTEDSEQLRRYLRSFPNLLLTNYLDFRWFVDGKLRLSASLGRKNRDKKLEVQGPEAVRELLTAFLHPPTLLINSPKELAQRMAGVAQLIRLTLNQALSTASENEPLAQQLQGFRKVLIEDLSIEQFSDMYAQTLCYGLFAARCNVTPGAEQRFSREHAAFDLPKTNPFLRQFFGTIAGQNLDDRISWAVDDLVNLLNHTDIAHILRDFGKKNRREDPVVHFYETFLTAYDAQIRSLRGVFYTPEPVVQYIVRSVDYVLQSVFHLPDGLADITQTKHKTRKTTAAKTAAKTRRNKQEMAEERESEREVHKVLVLDPAAGTGTFLSAVIDLIHERVSLSGASGAWSDYVSKHLLPRIFGFELLMAPYAVAHMKLGLQLTRTGYDFHSPERLRVFLTNTLEAPHDLVNMPLFGGWLAEEANAAGDVKRDLPIMVIVGNPPYSNFGRLNRGEWIRGLLDDYKKDLNERKLNLDDAFIKFIRFSQWRIDQSGSGILAFITSNTFLDGITHRRMRESLMGSFSDIYILNLHGSSKKLERTPDNGKDENVFDIRQGVAIAILVKGPKTRSGPARLHHSDLWGLRDEKYTSLDTSDLSTTNWSRLDPKSPLYFFVPKDLSHIDEFTSYRSLKDGIFKSKNTGIQTKRDRLVYHIERSELDLVLDDLKSLPASRLTKKYDLPDDGRDWTVAGAAEDVRLNPGVKHQVLYHPFDMRWTWYSGKTKGLMAYPRSPLMKSALMPNLLLLTVRNARRGNVDSFFVAAGLVDKDAVSPFDNATFFPLYVYPSAAEETAQTAMEGHERQLNLSEDLLTEISEGLGMVRTTLTSEPELVVSYIYAILFSPNYRSRYSELLRTDYPRIPFTSQTKLFEQLCSLGKILINAHLLKHQIKNVSNFPQSGSGLVERPEFKNSRVYINEAQYFEGVSDIIWSFRIGGYPVLEKWLKERRGRALTFSEVQYFHRIVSALDRTIHLSTEIDKEIDKFGGWPIK